MRTIIPGAARRRETTETVRRRLAVLLTSALRGSPAAADGRPFRPPPDTSDGGAAPGSAGPTAQRPQGPGSSGRPGTGDGRPPPAPPRVRRSVRGRRHVRDGPPATHGAGPPPDLGSPFGEATAPGPADVPRSAQARRLAFALPPGLSLDRRAALGLAALLLLAVGYAVQHFWLNRPEAVAVPASVGSSAPAATHGTTGPPGSPAPTVVVDVAGKVEHPGLRTLPTGSRVADALRAAGGALAGTDTDGLNLARVLSDGEQILVGAPAGQAVTAPGRAALVSLNQATAAQLDTLPGVGPTLAQRILLYRQEHGPFRSIDQLRQVPGIGEKKFSEIRSLLTL
ncbi:ComEA family DNA-binding protein [Kitasatospora sp. NBC_01539]|uniref:ComEA family DNA-binding protein n=1 Tax=Kitasatospora sp. NBC_01539 TaxID=2903577 RepID=UPI00386017AC